MSELSESESSKEEVEVGEDDDKKEKKEEENLDDDDDDLSWTSTDGVNEEEIVISSVTAEVFQALFFFVCGAYLSSVKFIFPFLNFVDFISPRRSRQLKDSEDYSVYPQKMALLGKGGKVWKG